MMSFLRKPVGAASSLAMLLSLFLVPQLSLAKAPGMSDGGGHSPGGGEGDPLDSNDYSSGGGGSDVHSGRIIPRDIDEGIIKILGNGQMMILRVDYIGDIPVFTVEVIAVQMPRAEASHVR